MPSAHEKSKILRIIGLEENTGCTLLTHKYAHGLIPVARVSNMVEVVVVVVVVVEGSDPYK